MVAARSPVERLSTRPVSAMRSPVTRTAEAIVAPVTRINPATSRNPARMSAPAEERRCEADPELGLADDPPAGLEAGRAPELAVGQPPGTDPQGSRRERQGERRGQAQRAGAQRPPRWAELANQHQRPAAHQRSRDRVAELAERELGRPDGPVAERAPAPVQIGDAGQEDSHGDQRQPDYVNLVGREVRRPERRAAGQQRAFCALARSPGRGLLRALLLGAGGSHIRGDGFDGGARAPARRRRRITRIKAY